MEAELGKAKKPLTIAGVLASALDMEDEIAHSVYRDYMKREMWPKELSDSAYETIRGHLTVLLNETHKHQRMIQTLRMRLLGNEGQK